MEEKFRLVFTQKFHEWFNDYYAEQFAINTMEVSHLWDDVVDGDKYIEDTRANKVFEWLTIGLHYNPFFNSYKHSLLPIMQTIITAWHTANTFEQNKEETNKSYVLRALIYTLFAEIARCLGKDATHVSIEAWKLYGETLQEIQGEVNA